VHLSSTSLLRCTPPTSCPTWISRVLRSDPHIRACGSGLLREWLKKQGFGLIEPYRSNNKQQGYEDGYKLRRNNCRWIIERTKPGSVNSADCWFVMSACSPLTAPSCTSPTSGLLAQVFMNTHSAFFYPFRKARFCFHLLSNLAKLPHRELTF
jgi:hypothetical protein